MSARGSSQGKHARRTVAVGLVIAITLAACTSTDRNGATTTTKPGTTTSSNGASSTDGSTSTSTRNGTTNPLGATGVRLSKGHAQTAAADPVPVVDGTPIDDAAVQSVESRLPAWTTDDSASQLFRFPAATNPPPRAGATIDIPFPARVQLPPVTATSGPLHVLRHQPDGAVAIAPFVSITFDQPMVPIATVGQLDAAAVPASITPAVPGRWQWIGTDTLRFDATSALVDRLPMATTYTVTVAAGTKSATGGVLVDPVSFDFATPAVTVQSFQPTGDSLPLTPIFLATFDQRVDPAAVLSTTTLDADGASRTIRLASAAEVAADVAVQQALGSVPDGRWIAFRAVDPLPAGAPVTVHIGPGTPSAEGPLTTTDAATYNGRTYDPLRVTDVTCGYGDSCPPTSDFDITFNNALDSSLFDPSTIHIDPPIDGAQIAAFGNTVVIHGATVGRTKYTVTIPAGLTDTFGQKFAADEDHVVKTGSAAPILQQFTQPLTTLDPLSKQPSVTVVTVNHPSFRVRVFTVRPADWPAYLQYAQNVMQNGQASSPVAAPTWPKVIDKTITVDDKQDQAVETTVDLSAALSGGHGHLVVLVEPTEQYDSNSNDYWSNRPTITWAQATAIGIDAFVDVTNINGWATNLADGSPLAGVQIGLMDGSTATATTDADGLAHVPAPVEGTSGLVATIGADSAILPAAYYGTEWKQSLVPDKALWYVFDDRQTYRPGETVSVKGWIRRLTLSKDSQLQLIGNGATVAYSARDGQGNVIATGTASLGVLGGFDFTVSIPDGANLGYATIDLQLSGVDGVPDGAFTHSFQIQDFRRPEFEVAARNESVGPFVQGQPVTVAVDANYYAGGPLTAAPVNWQVTTAAASYSPPGWDEFNFGTYTPWWLSDFGAVGGGPNQGFSEGPCCGSPTNGATPVQFSGTTDAGGSDYLQIDVGALDPSRAGLPIAVTAQATVTDVNRQAWASTTNVLVHPADLYVGLRGERTFVQRGDPLVVDAVVTDIDGKAVAGRTLRVTASRTESKYENGSWVDSPVDPQTCDITSGVDPVPCTFTTSTGGTYTVTSTVTDDKGRPSKSELTRWVSGAVAPPTRTVDEQALTVVPDKAMYNPGDTAGILVQSPFATGDGLLTLTRSGIVSTQRFQVVDGSAVLHVPITDHDIPGLGATIEVVGATPRTADDGTALPDAALRPAYATGQVTISISTASRALTVTATPKDPNAAPGTATSVDVTVTDSTGKPVAGGELAVVVVDEAVLALSNSQIQDPLATFYAELPAYLWTQYGRQSIVLANPLTLNGAEGGTTAATTADSAAGGAPATTVVPAPGGVTSEAGFKSASPAADTPAGQGATPTPVSVRTNFDALAVFEPSVATDASGHATIAVPLPDNLTRYRVMVVAVDGPDRFGSAQANITARLPLMVRPSAPRFLNFGDVFELPVIIQNQTDSPMETDVVLQGDNLTIADGPGKHVTVPANNRIEVRFAVSAAQAGTARFRVAAVSGDNADAATIQLPVYTPATSEAFATYGVIDDGAILQPVAAPTDVIPQFGGLDITTSSTSLQSLTDAVLYLSQYPYQSSDAMASRILAITSLRDVLGAFAAPGLPTPDQLDAAVKSDIDGLVALQGDDGGFPYWEHGKASDPFNSVQATHALLVAKAGGFPVPQNTIDRGVQFLAEIETHIPAEWGQDARDSVEAYALNVRMIAGDRDPAKAKLLFESRKADLPLDAIAWLWPVVSDRSTSNAINTIIENKAVDTAGAVTFTTAVSDGQYLTLQSDRRTDGLILDALIAVKPASDLIPKVVAGLLAGQSQGRWDNVQENSFILLALKRYFDTYEKQTPDFVAQIWLGDQFAGDHSFVGRSTDRAQLSIPTAQLIAAGDSGITLNKQGTGRLYYRIGLRTAPSDLTLQPLDRGFVVQRTYEGADDPSDVTRDADGTWHIKAGARVRVRLTMVAESQRTHVALTDPLPAGLEIQNPELATTPDAPPDPQQSGNNGGFGVPVGGGDGAIIDYLPWYPTWFDHQNMRDDRAEAFATVLGAGEYDYSYIARATTPGTFVVPPVKAEEMYSPETFGRGGTDKVVIAG